MKRLLGTFSQQSLHPSPLNDRLLDATKELSSLPKDIFAMLLDEPESFSECPLSEDAADDIRITCANALELRLKGLQARDMESGSSPMPEIRLEPDAHETPGISLTTFDSGIPESSATSKTLLHSRKSLFGNAHEKHCSALLRLLYLHNSINPGNLSTYTASLLVPLYSAMIQEVETEDLMHVEADTFWVLEAMVAEFSALDDDGGKLWMKKISERVSWADYDLFTQLVKRAAIIFGLSAYSSFTGFLGAKSSSTSLLLVSSDFPRKRHLY